MSQAPYPSTWPKAKPTRPAIVATRITESQKLALYNREITTRDLAKALNVAESYLSEMFPGKIPPLDMSKTALAAVRKEFRMQEAHRVASGALKLDVAAELCRVSVRTMYRALNAARRISKEPVPTAGEQL